MYCEVALYCEVTLEVGAVISQREGAWRVSLSGFPGPLRSAVRTIEVNGRRTDSGSDAD